MTDMNINPLEALQEIGLNPIILDEHGFVPYKATSNALDVAVTAMFMAEGLISSGYNKVLEHWGQGAIELMQALAEYAALADRLNNTGFYVRGDSPGVFDYEVSNAFGYWFGKYIIDNAAPPSTEVCSAWLLVETEAYFCTADMTDDDNETLSTVLERSCYGR